MYLVLLFTFLRRFWLPAARGIDEANDDNSCRVEQNSSVDCVVILDLRTTNGVDVATGARGEIRGANQRYLYWMAGATGCGLIWAIVSTLMLITLSELIRAHYKVEEKRHHKRKVAAER